MLCLNVIHSIAGFGNEWNTKRVKKGITPFYDVLNILKKGFKGHHHDENAYLKMGKFHRMNFDWMNPSNVEGITKGDSYHLEIIPNKGGYPWTRTDYSLKKRERRR